MANNKKNNKKKNNNDKVEPLQGFIVDNNTLVEMCYQVECPECKTPVAINREMNKKGEVYCSKCKKTVLYFPPDLFSDLM